MKLVTLAGISRRGKNRVFEQGSNWKIIGEANAITTVRHRGCAGPFLCLRSMDDPEETRWVSLTDDPDFEVIMN